MIREGLHGSQRDPSSARPMDAEGSVGQGQARTWPAWRGRTASSPGGSQTERDRLIICIQEVFRGLDPDRSEGPAGSAARPA